MKGRFTLPFLTAWHLTQGQVTVEKDNFSVSAKSGDWLVIAPGERYQNFSQSARILSLHLSVGYTATAAMWRGRPVVVIPSDHKLNLYSHRIRKIAASHHQAFDHLLHLQSLDLSLFSALDWQEKVIAFARRLFSLLDRRGFHFQRININDSRVLKTWKQVTESNFHGPFSRTLFARQAGVSASQLDRIWRVELGQTPRQCWEQLRVQHACYRLQYSRSSIKEIAYDLGFGHLSQFSSWFRHHKKETPRNFQKRHQRGPS